VSTFIQFISCIVFIHVRLFFSRFAAMYTLLSSAKYSQCSYVIHSFSVIIYQNTVNSFAVLQENSINFTS